MMRNCVMLMCLVMVVPAMARVVEQMQVEDLVDMENQWTKWKALHGKQYSSPKEEEKRRLVFYKKLVEIEEHNSKYPTQVSYFKGLNQFSDLTLEEYRQYNKLTMKSRQAGDGGCNSTFLRPLNLNLPETVDWRTKGYVTPVKDQGQCGSCWAFSATGSLEGQHFRKTGTLLSLSEQQLVDCSWAEGNRGCGGGLMNSSFKYIMTQPGGLETEANYPYTAEDDSCHSKPSLEQAQVTGCVDVTSGDEQALKEAVASVGPVSVGIDAGNQSFESYSGGVYSEPNCNPRILNHGVLVVGYGTLNGQDYWLVKNSWNSLWGLNGYIMMARNMGNMCGIASLPSYPTV